MLEFVSSRDLIDKAKINWNILPQMQVSLSKRQHILASAGVQFPMNKSDGPHYRSSVLRPVGLVRRRLARGLEMTRAILLVLGALVAQARDTAQARRSK